jgi:hypothetical protein
MGHPGGGDQLGGKIEAAIGLVGETIPEPGDKRPVAASDVEHVARPTPRLGASEIAELVPGEELDLQGQQIIPAPRGRRRRGVENLVCHAPGRPAR